MKAYILNREIDNIRATLYRQTMFAELKGQSFHNRKEHPLTLEVITSEYRNFLRHTSATLS
jgi:oligoendopeptidase F